MSSICRHLWLWPVVMVTAAKRDEQHIDPVSLCPAGELSSVPGRSRCWTSDGQQKTTSCSVDGGENPPTLPTKPWFLTGPEGS